MDCGFFIESIVLALACVGLCAALIELRCLGLRRRLGKRLRVTVELDCTGAEGKPLLIWRAEQLVRLRWPGAMLRITGATGAEARQAHITGGEIRDGTAGTGEDRRDSGSADL